MRVLSVAEKSEHANLRNPDSYRGPGSPERSQERVFLHPNFRELDIGEVRRIPPLGSLAYGGSPLLLLLLGEGLAQFLLLLLWEVGGDDLEVVLPELVYHPVRCRRPAGQSKQRRRSLSDLLSHLLDEVIVDPNVGHRTRMCSHPSPDCRTEERDEEDQPEQEAPEGSTQGTRASC